jgi:transposase InsO family protein
LFSAPFNSDLNPSECVQTKDGRVLVGPTRWETLIIYKDCNTVTKIDEVMNLHIQLGHRSASYLKYLVKQDTNLQAKIKDIRKLDHPIYCQVCNAAKSQTTKRRRECPHATRFGESWHADFKIYSLPSSEGHTCILGFIDSYSRYAKIFPLTNRKGDTCATTFRTFFNKILEDEDFPITSFQKCRIIVDNAGELNCAQVKDVCIEYGINLKTTNTYRHQDNSMIETFWRNESFVRAALLGAPHVDHRTWPYAWTHVTYVHNRFPHKYHGQGTNEQTDVMKPSPLEIITGKQFSFGSKENRNLGFGTPVTVHIPVETRKRGGNTKLLARGWNGYFLCLDNDQNYKGVIMNADTGTIEITGFFSPRYDITESGKLISNPSLENNVDLNPVENFNPDKISHTNIPLSQLTKATRNFHATKIINVATHYSHEDNETLGVVLTETIKLNGNVWIPVTEFLKANTARIPDHKRMLFKFLSKHFQFATNECFPIFVQSPVKLEVSKRHTETFPGLIVRTDAFSKRGYQVALFEDDNDNICDFHDCPREAIIKFEVANLAMATFPTLNSDTHSDQNRLLALLQPKKKTALTKRQKTFQNDPTIPQSYPHSQTFPNKKEWDDATRAEVHGLYETKKCLKPITYAEYEENYKNVKIIPSVMIYKIKVNSDGSIKKYKARLCAGGHKQVAGDGTFDETFAPTAGLTSIRLCLALAVNLNLRPYQLDVEQAFLNNELEYKMVMSLPPGIEIKGCKHVELLKGVYGLKQAPALWYKHCYDAITSASGGLLQRSKSDPCLFFHFGQDFTVLLTVTVDDFAIFTDNKTWLENFKTEFNKIYAITQEPDFSWFLGIRLQWNEDFTSVKLDQPNDIRKGLIRFGLQDVKHWNTPMASDFESEPAPKDNVNPDFPYAALIGVLLWIARMTRPDIQLAVTLLASHMSSFTEYHIKAAKRTLAYLKGTESLGLHITKMTTGFDLKKCKLELYSDSDWARDKIKRRSVTGYVGYFLNNPIVYRVCYQPTVALSSCEAEYMAMTDAAKEVLFFQNLFSEFASAANLIFPITLHVDNSAALSLSTTLISNKRSKHIDIRYHFLRDLHQRGCIKPTKIHTDDNNADIFTKPLDDKVFNRHRPALIKE